MNRNEWLAAMVIVSVIMLSLLVLVVAPVMTKLRTELDKEENAKFENILAAGRNMTGIPIRNPNEPFYCGCDKVFFAGICEILCKVQD